MVRWQIYKIWIQFINNLRYREKSLLQIKKGKMEEKGTIPVKSANGNHMEVPKLGYYLSMWACLSRGYTKLGLLCRSKYSVWQNLKSNLVQTKAIAAATPSSNIHEIRQFLGLGNFFQTTVKNFAQIHNIISECAWGC